MQVAKYSKGNDLLSETLYPLCFPTCLRQCTIIIPQVKSIYWKQTYKYGVRVLNSVEEAVCINKNSGNTIWQDDMDKWMINNSIKFDVWEEWEALPGVYKKMTVHMVFGIKLDAGFTQKSRFV